MEGHEGRWRHHVPVWRHDAPVASRMLHVALHQAKEIIR